MDAASDSPAFDDLVDEAEPEDVDDDDLLGLGTEYAVVAPRLSALTLAYAAFVAVFAWFEIFFMIWDGDRWPAAFAGGFVIAALGTFAAWRARRARRTFATLVALLLDGGLVLAILVPVLGFVFVFYR